MEYPDTDVDPRIKFRYLSGQEWHALPPAQQKLADRVRLHCAANGYYARLKKKFQDNPDFPAGLSIIGARKAKYGGRILVEALRYNEDAVMESYYKQHLDAEDLFAKYDFRKLHPGNRLLRAQPWLKTLPRKEKASDFILI